eukprot:TRINITY_DN9661_c0_g1_i6.p1 TRINITY_DN9661_c0_g1~~TRINITY_DN9661_c0_g1_i6.p1  ORF type:complete len:131 (-),score=38.50 TRINITY_DN9661_c0_g1_i6:36-428(-)
MGSTPSVDVDRLECNDVIAICRTYGIEAGRAALIGEVKRVFRAYGINVNHRHLALIADYMTFGGRIKPMNRQGMEENFSPFLKMSFEVTNHFLTQAALFHEHDEMKTPSAQIVLGPVSYTHLTLPTIYSV